MIQLIWSLFGEAEIDLFASEENAHCQMLTNAPPEWGSALESLAPGAQICFSSSKNHVAGAAQDQRAARDCAASGAKMAEPAMVSGTDGASNSPSVAHLLSQAKGSVWHPRPELWNLHVWQVSAKSEQ